MKIKLVCDLQAYVRLNQKYPGAVELADRIQYFFPWKRSLKNGISSLSDQTIWVVFKAKKCIDAILKPGMKVFEYGMGGSTLYFLRNRCVVFSAEHHREWYQTIAAQITKNNYPDWRGFLREPDKERRMSAEPDPRYNCCSDFEQYKGQSFFDYVQVIDQFGDNSFDVVLIDGRARVSCFQRAYRKVKPGGSLVLDNSERPRYRPIHQALEGSAWRKQEFFGPGPYVSHEFWGTTVWTRLE